MPVGIQITAEDEQRNKHRTTTQTKQSPTLHKESVERGEWCEFGIR